VIYIGDVSDCSNDKLQQLMKLMLGGLTIALYTLLDCACECYWLLWCKWPYKNN